MAQNNILAVIDIGSAETKVFITDLQPRLRIIGGVCGKTEGMRNGEIVNLEALKESVHAVIQNAERQAGVVGRIPAACLAVSGVSVGGTSVQGVASVKTGKVSDADIEAARADAVEVCLSRLPEGRHIVQLLPRKFRLDSRELDRPKDFSGEKLFCDMWAIDADDKYLVELYQIPNRYGMEVRGLYSAALASAESLRNLPQARGDMLVLDIGAGTTDFALLRNRKVVKTGVVPVGGNHITNDLARGLNLSPEDAERLKLNFGKAFVQESDVTADIDLASPPENGNGKELTSHRVSRYKMCLVIEVRLRELFEIIYKKVSSEFAFSGTIFLTGGTSNLTGIDRLAGSVFSNAEVRRGEPLFNFAQAYAEPKFATAVGLAALYFSDRSRLRRRSGRVSALKRFFRGMFR